VVDYQRIIHQQAIREAEGYLDLAMGLSEPLQLDQRLQDRLARRALRALARLDEDRKCHPLALYLTGQAYRVMQRFDEAVSPLTQAAQREPENIGIWLALAWCQKRIDRLDLAIESLENALAVESSEAILHYNLACYWSLAGNAKIALRYLAQSLSIDPSYRELVADETDFDPIRDLPDFQSLVGVIV
jgi:tetratricopeptide (TPR) repeat protein